MTNVSPQTLLDKDVPPGTPKEVTLRDWFALQVLPGCLSRGGPHHREATQEAYRIADAMLEARSKLPV